jgi:hypothetical protein
MSEKEKQEYVNTLARREVATPNEVNSLVEEKEYFLMVGFNNVTYEYIEVWFVDSGSYHHMTGMRSIFLTFSKINTYFYVGSGTNTRQEQ